MLAFQFQRAAQTWNVGPRIEKLAPGAPEEKGLGIYKWETGLSTDMHPNFAYPLSSNLMLTLLEKGYCGC